MSPHRISGLFQCFISHMRTAETKLFCFSFISLFYFTCASALNFTEWLKRCMKMEFERTRQRGHPRKTWWDCVKVDMESFGLSREDAQDRDYWRLRVKVETG